MVRAQFVSELSALHLQDLASLNAYLWAWIERDYHRREHSKLEGLSPLQRWQQDLTQVRSLGPYAATLDELFFHRERRKVRRDGTISFWGEFFEVPYELSGRTILVVTDPHLKQITSLETIEGKPLGKATPLDRIKNNCRHRHRASTPEPATPIKQDPEFNVLDQAYDKYHSTMSDIEE